MGFWDSVAEGGVKMLFIFPAASVGVGHGHNKGRGMHSISIDQPRTTLFPAEKNLCTEKLTPLFGLVFPDQPMPIDDILISDPLSERHIYLSFPIPSVLVLMQVVHGSGPIIECSSDDDGFGWGWWPGEGMGVVG